MPTDDLLAYLTNKKLLPFALVKDEFFDYLRNLSEMVLESTYRAPGVYDAVATVTGIVIGEVSVAGAFEATDGEGKKFEFGALDSRLQDVPFENTNAVAYNIGLRSVDMVEELEINPRTGQPEYSKQKENIGTLGIPDAVVDNGTNLTLIVDAVTESGVSHAGRTVRVYLLNPLAIAWVDSYEDIVVAWDSTNNKITTTGLLGQSAGSVSTTAADYVVVELGPVLVRVATQDLRSATGVVFLAEFDGVTGSSPTPDMTDQNILTGSLSDLADITRIANSDLKVSVRAVPADSGEDQLRAESSGGSRVWGVDEAGKHWLPNASVGIPLDDSGHFGGLGVPWNSESFGGAINELGHTSSVAMGPMVLVGLEISGSGGGGNVNFITGSAWMPGTNKESGGARHWTSPSLAVPDGAGNYIYIHPVNGLQTTTTKSIAYASGNLPLYIVEMAAGSIFDQQDIAYRAGSLHRRGIITVSSGGTDSPSSNFKSLQAALDFVDGMMDQDSGEWPGVELWILDDIDVGSDGAIVRQNSDGLTIKGVNWGGHSNGRTKVYYGDTNTVDQACFIIEADNVRFIGVHFESQRTGAGHTTSCVRQAYNPHVASVKTEFHGCKFSASNTNLSSPLRGSTDWVNCRFFSCEFDITGTTPTDVQLVKSGGSYWVFEDCKVSANTTNGNISNDQATLQNVVFSRCELLNVNDVNIATQAPSISVVVKFDKCYGSLGIVENGELIGCDFTSTRLVTAGADDRIKVIGGSIAGDDLIQKDYAGSEVMLSGVVVTVSNNYFVGGTAPSNIEITHCYITGSLSTNIPISLDANCILAYNKQIGPFRTVTNQGVSFIEVDGTNTKIVGNNIDASYYCASVHCTVNAVRTMVALNDITNPTEYSTGTTAIGIEVLANFGGVVISNVIHDIGGATYGGLGIYIGSDSVVVKGNVIIAIEGAGIHLDDSAARNVISGNVLDDVGLATQTNSRTGAVSDFGILCDGGDRNNIVENNINAAVGDGIELAIGSTYNVCQLNIISNSGGGIDNNGTNNMVGASLSNNNID